MARVDKVGQVYETYFVYIITNQTNAVLYTGITSELEKRCIQHRNKHYPDSFTARYNINKLVYYERFNDINAAIAREKQIKAGSRQKKLNLVAAQNPNWLDLFEARIGTDWL